MGAFSPKAADSPFELANWPFAGIAVLAGLAASVSVVVTVTAASFWGVVGRTLDALPALCFALQLLFEAVAALFAATVEREPGDSEP